MDGKVRDAANCNKNLFGKYSNWQEKIMFSELWKVAAKYENWQENIVNKSQRSSKICTMTVKNWELAGNDCKWKKKLGGPSGY